MKKVYDGLDIGEFTDNLIVWFKLMTVAEFLISDLTSGACVSGVILSFPARRVLIFVFRTGSARTCKKRFHVCSSIMYLIAAYTLPYPPSFVSRKK